MKNILIYALVFTAISVSAASIPASTIEVYSYDKPDTLSHPQRAWLGALEWCESNGKPEAVNPNDSDNTPSYGILQFKPATFLLYAPKYGITTTNYKDPDAQEQIVEYWITHPGEVDFRKQFPGCTAKLGIPPKLSTTTIDKK